MYGIYLQYSECIQFEKFVLTFVVAAVTFFTRLIFFSASETCGKLETPENTCDEACRPDEDRFFPAMSYPKLTLRTCVRGGPDGQPMPIRQDTPLLRTMSYLTLKRGQKT